MSCFQTPPKKKKKSRGMEKLLRSLFSVIYIFFVNVRFRPIVNQMVAGFVDPETSSERAKSRVCADLFACAPRTL